MTRWFVEVRAGQWVEATAECATYYAAAGLPVRSEPACQEIDRETAAAATTPQGPVEVGHH